MKTLDAFEAEMANLARGVVSGKIDGRAALDLLGQKVAGWCQARIAAGIAPALKPATAFGPPGLPRIPFDVFELKGCQE